MIYKDFRMFGQASSVVSFKCKTCKSLCVVRISRTTGFDEIAMVHRGHDFDIIEMSPGWAALAGTDTDIDRLNELLAGLIKAEPAYVFGN